MTTILIILGVLSSVAIVYLVGRNSGVDSTENDVMKESLDDIGLAKRVREDEKKIIEARDKFTRGS